MALTLEEEKKLAELEKEFAGSVMSPNYQPPGFLRQFGQAAIQNLPELGGMVGGAVGLLGTRSPAGAELGSVLGSTAIRSMIGAGLGGATGEAGKQAITGRPSVTSLLRSGVEQALYDGTGNLIFTYGGKGYRLAKEQVSKLIGKEAPDSAVRAAQELLLQQNKGATLTQFQVDPTAMNSISEGLARSSFAGKSVFIKAERNLEAALKSAKTNVLDDISKNVYDAVSTGEQFAKAIELGDNTLKSLVKPFYQSLDQQGTGITVNVAPLSSEARGLVSNANRLNNLNLSASEIDILNRVADLPPSITFSDAHEILSSFKTRIRDLKVTSEPDSAAVAQLVRTSKAIEDAMNSSAAKLKGSAMTFEGRLAEDNVGTLLDQYRLYSNFYKDSITDLYSDTAARLLNKDPEFVGSTIFQNGSVTAFKETQRALARAKKLNPNLNVDDTLNGVRRGYLETLLKNEGSLQNLSEKLANDPKLRATFNSVLDEGSRKRVETLLKAAELSKTTPDTVAPLFFQAQQAGAVIQGAQLLGAATLVLSDDAQKVVTENPVWSTVGISTILLGPRFLAKTATSPEATNVTLGILKKAQAGEPIGKNLMLKTLQAWEQSGILPVDLQGAVKEQAPVGLTPAEEQRLKELEAEFGGQ